MEGGTWKCTKKNLRRCPLCSVDLRSHCHAWDIWATRFSDSIAGESNLSHPHEQWDKEKRGWTSAAKWAWSQREENLRYDRTKLHLAGEKQPTQHLCPSKCLKLRPGHRAARCRQTSANIWKGCTFKSCPKATACVLGIWPWIWNRKNLQTSMFLHSAS